VGGHPGSVGAGLKNPSLKPFQNAAYLRSDSGQSLSVIFFILQNRSHPLPFRQPFRARVGHNDPTHSGSTFSALRAYTIVTLDS
jgi:hypothetical protein